MLIKAGNLQIPSENIDYISEGDGTVYGRPFIQMKSGKRIDIESYADLETIVKKLESSNAPDQ